jgi:subtilisin family serine protease
MLRRIVVTRSLDQLSQAARKRSFDMAIGTLKKDARVTGMEFDAGHHPVRLPGGSLTLSWKPSRALGFDYVGLSGWTGGGQSTSKSSASQPTFAMRAMFKDLDSIERLKRDRSQNVVGVFADPKIAPFAPYCGAKAVGTYRDVAGLLSGPTKAGLTGKGVRIVIVDTGIDGNQVPVSGGWGPDPDYVPGSAPSNHGTMTAFDAKIGAPEADILDYALLRSTGGNWSAFLSDALTAFSNLMSLVQDGKGPVVVSNSWGLYDRSDDDPIGSDGNYSANPDHPFNQITGSLVEAGADVCFAAGNCGDACPDQRCGVKDVGPGASIHGANSHPDVITVAAVTINGDRLGYSSQGPGGLAKRKPDVAGFSHFTGSNVYTVDSGTSAACPVVAGLIAALRQSASTSVAGPQAMKTALQRSAKNPAPGGWDNDLGYGVIDSAAVMAALGLPLAPAAPAMARLPAPQVAAKSIAYSFIESAPRKT